MPICLFQSPQAAVTLILFPDDLFLLFRAAVGESVLILSTLRAVVLGQREEWMGLLYSMQGGHLMGLLPHCAC